MFTIKVAFKGKNFLIGKGTNSFLKIAQEVENRFPNECPHGAIFKYGQRQLDKFQEVESIVAENNLKSIKIEVVPLQQKKEVPKEPEAEISEQPEKIVEEEKKEEEKKEEPVQEEKQQKPIQPVEVNESVDITEIKSNEKSLQNTEAPIIKTEEKQEQIVVIEKADELIPKITTSEMVEIEVPEKRIDEVKIQIEEPAEVNPIEVVEIELESVKIQEEVKPVIEEQKQPSLLSSKISEPSKKEEIEEQKIQEKVPEKVQVQEPQMEEQIEEKAEEKVEDESEIYRCFYCDGRSMLCRVCESEGRFTEGSRFIKLIDRIVEKRLDKKFQAFLARIQNARVQEKVEEKVEEKKEIKMEEKIDLSTLEIELKHSNINKEVYNVGEMIQWKFMMKVKGLSEQLEDVFIIDEKTGITLPHKIQEGIQFVQVGPFPATHEGRFDKTFRIFFRNNESEMQFIGPKFGFNVQVQKQVEKKKLHSELRELIEKKKKALKIGGKQTQYIIERLKEMGINQDNFNDSKQLLDDILQTI